MIVLHINSYACLRYRASDTQYTLMSEHRVTNPEVKKKRAVQE